MIQTVKQMEENHQAYSKLVGNVWVFNCDECTFEASYVPALKRFQIMICGNPFVSHTCHHEKQEPSIRDLINDLQLSNEEMEIEY